MEGKGEMSLNKCGYSYHYRGPHLSHTVVISILSVEKINMIIFNADYRILRMFITIYIIVLSMLYYIHCMNTVDILYVCQSVYLIQLYDIQPLSVYLINSI